MAEHMSRSFLAELRRRNVAAACDQQSPVQANEQVALQGSP